MTVRDFVRRVLAELAYPYSKQYAQRSAADRMAHCMEAVFADLDRVAGTLPDPTTPTSKEQQR